MFTRLTAQILIVLVLGLKSLWAFDNFTTTEIKDAATWAYAIYRKTPEMTNLVEKSSLFYERSTKEVMNIGWLFRVDPEDKRKIMLVFLGSDSLQDFLLNIDGRFAHDPYFKTGNVHNGFLNGFLSIQDRIYEKLDNYCKEHSLTFSEVSLTLVGHSLGGAAAILAASYFKTNLQTKDLKFKIITFSSPRVGDEKFVESFTQAVAKNSHLNFCRVGDGVPFLPIGTLSYQSLGTYIQVSSSRAFKKHQTHLKKLANNSVNPSASSFQETFIIPAIVEAHNMKFYLELVNLALDDKNIPFKEALKKVDYLEKDVVIETSINYEKEDELWKKLYYSEKFGIEELQTVYDFYGLTFQSSFAHPISWGYKVLQHFLLETRDFIKLLVFILISIFLFSPVSKLLITLIPIRYKKSFEELITTIKKTFFTVLYSRIFMGILTFLILGISLKNLYAEKWFYLTCISAALSFIPLIGVVMGLSITLSLAIFNLQPNTALFLYISIYVFLFMSDILLAKYYLSKYKKGIPKIFLLFLSVALLKTHGVLGLSFIVILYPFLQNIFNWHRFNRKKRYLKT